MTKTPNLLSCKMFHFESYLVKRPCVVRVWVSVIHFIGLAAVSTWWHHFRHVFDTLVNLEHIFTSSTYKECRYILGYRWHMNHIFKEIPQNSCVSCITIGSDISTNGKSVVIKKIYRWILLDWIGIGVFMCFETAPPLEQHIARH